MHPFFPISFSLLKKETLNPNQCVSLRRQREEAKALKKRERNALANTRETLIVVVYVVVIQMTVVAAARVSPTRSRVDNNNDGRRSRRSRRRHSSTLRHHHHLCRRRRINDDDAKRTMSLSRLLLRDEQRGRAATLSTTSATFFDEQQQQQSLLLVEDARRAVDAFVDDASSNIDDATLGVSTLVRHAMRAMMAETHPVAGGSVSIIVVVALALFTRRRSAAANRKDDDDDDELPKVYDDAQIARYWSRRPEKVVKRSAGLMMEVLVWATALVGDVASNAVEKNAPIRAKALKELIARQGAAFVKVGQAVAIRPDLLPPAYLEEFQTLLDQVEAFPSEDARRLIQKTIGENVRLEDVFEDVSCFDEPIAAASIGQVYKATLKKGALKKSGEEADEYGRTVAVKVQRPDILEAVSIDLFVIRSFLDILSSIPKTEITFDLVNGCEGLIPVLEVAAARFLEELDYEIEGRNASRFEEDMNSISVVRGAIKVPHVFREISDRQVICQEWVVGQKLTEIAMDNSEKSLAIRKKLVETLLNSYMVQFLETGFLHADPHPGNFMLMEDGRLAILDYGMMTEIGEEQRIAFVEYIAHLSAKEYSKTLDDLVNLGFIPQALADSEENKNIVVPVLAEMLETLYGSGGGATSKIASLQEQQSSRVGELSNKLEALSKEYPLQLPPYFVLILRAFGTLEGLGLSTDENYAIVDQCFPYIARRLLSDDSPRMRKALKSFIYGGSDRLRVSRVRSISSGFSQFTNNMGTVEVAKLNASNAVNIDPATKDVVKLIFNEKGNYLQDLVVDEAVRAADSLSRQTATATWKALATLSPVIASTSLLSGTILIPGLNFPFLLSVLAANNQEKITLTMDDKRNLALLRSILDLFGVPSLGKAIERAAETRQIPHTEINDLRMLAPSEIEALMRLVPEAAPGLQNMSSKFASKLSARLVSRAQDDLSGFDFPDGIGMLGQAAQQQRRETVADSR
jgi:aarF domain-containing kinase